MNDHVNPVFGGILDAVCPAAKVGPAAKHTPEPWSQSMTRDALAVCDLSDGTKWTSWEITIKAGRQIVARCGANLPHQDALGTPYALSVAELQANADLLTAAPETAAELDRLREVNAVLLDALRLAEKWLDGWGTSTQMTFIRAAIDKAEGGAA